MGVLTIPMSFFYSSLGGMTKAVAQFFYHQRLFASALGRLTKVLRMLSCYLNGFLETWEG